MARISIIVPCFNVKRYLPQCLDSILNQTLKDLEIILINDGSTDSSGTIIDSYAHSDPRIIALHQKNSGVSAARNKGLDQASAPYILFVDSDDWIDPEMAEELYHKAEGSSADLVVCDYYQETPDYSIPDFLGLRAEELILEEIGLPNFYFQYITKISLDRFACNKLYKKEILLQKGLRFSSSITFAEDNLFNLCYFLHTHKVAILNRSFYHYRQRQGSIFHSKQLDKITPLVTLVELFMNYSCHQDQAKSLKGVFPHLLHLFLHTAIKNCYENSVSPRIIKKQLHKVTREKTVLTLMKQLARLQLLNYKLPGCLERQSICRRFRTGLFALLVLARMHRTLFFLSRLWLRYRRFQKPEDQKPKKLFPAS